MSNKTQQAFPSENAEKYLPGMTYRQWLVGMAMQGLLVHVSHVPENHLALHPERLAQRAVEIADAVQAEEAK
jgi:hypothetical protein